MGLYLGNRYGAVSWIFVQKLLQQVPRVAVLDFVETLILELVRPGCQLTELLLVDIICEGKEI
jgi:hypothetical protein